MNHAPDLDATLMKILHELTAVPTSEIRPEHLLQADLGMDSVASMELVSMLSEELGIDVDIEQAMDVQDVAGVRALALRYLPHD